MGWFTKKIKDPEEVFSRLIQRDKKVSDKAKDEFITCLNSSHIEFLVNKFESTENSDVRLSILEIFAAKNDILSEQDLRLILTLIKYPDPVYRETFTVSNFLHAGLHNFHCTFFFTWCKVRAWDGSKASRAIPDETFCSARRYEDTCEKHLYKILPRMWGKERRSL